MYHVVFEYGRRPPRHILAPGPHACPERDGFIAKLKKGPRTREDILVEIAQRVAEMEDFDETPSRRIS